MPRNLVTAAVHEGRDEWLDTIPDTVARLSSLWSIEVGAPFQPGGATAWVAPAISAGGARRALKIMWSHPEALHEADGLRAWSGHGAVEIYADDRSTDTIAMLLELCVPGTTLAELPEQSQDVVVAGLLRRLWAASYDVSTFRPLQEMCSFWADQAEAGFAAQSHVLDPALVSAGLGLFRSLPASASSQVLLCTDLHAENVLAAEREPWLVIDPKPYVGDPTYDALQHMLNCPGRLHADPRGLVARMADLLELDPDRLLQWLFARCVQESSGWPELADVARRIAP